MYLQAPTKQTPIATVVSWLGLAPVIALLIISFNTAMATDFPEPDADNGLFLIATDQLQGTSFQKAVILITHYSHRGATGLTINRPTEIPLKQVLPHISHLAQSTSLLFLGGPVNTNAIFVLLRSQHPLKNMHRIANDVYFSTGKNAFRHSISGSSRTYAGYAGWTSRQLQAEIQRGDWLVIQTDPSIIFEEKPGNLWDELMKTWSGNWI